MNTTAISCAMTTHNSMAYLKEQLDSLKNQTLPIDEVIIVDDASEDETVSFIENYLEENALSHWKLIAHDTNQGYISSFRDALRACTHELIFLCDHDDIWYPEKTETMAELFASQPGLKALASSFDLIDSEGAEIPDRVSSRRANHNLIRRSIHPGVYNPMNFDDLMAYNIAPGCTIACTQGLARQYLDLPDAFDLPHDWALCAIAAIENGLCYLDKPLMGYRQHDANTLGLARRTEFEERREAAKIDARQKQALLDLATRFNATPSQIEKMTLIKNVFEERSAAMDEKSMFALATLLFSSIGSGYAMTIGMDMRSLLTRGSKE